MSQYPPARAGWALTLLLTLTYILSYVDRSILGLLIEPIKDDIAISDEQMGYLIGPAFALFYATMGLPMGWLADRTKRTKMLAAGVLLWSVATAFSGLARSFGQLFVARMSVGVGEAVLGPCAMSMIGDSFPPEKRGKPVGIYSTALSLGAGIASLVGAGVLVWATTSGTMAMPLFGEMKPWQLAFMAVGVPGVLLSVTFLFFTEPPRQTTGATPEASSFGAMLSHLRAHWAAFGGLILLVSVMTITAYSHAFLPSAFARRFGWEVADYAVVNGLMTLALGPVTVAGIGILADKWRAAGRDDAPFRLLSFGFVLMVVANGAAMLMPNVTLAFVALGLTTVAIGIITATGILSLLDITPAAIRGQVVAIYYMVISVAGLGLGPTGVGMLSTRVYGEDQLHLAVATAPVLFAAIPLLLLPFIARAYRARKAAVQAEVTSEAAAA